MEAALHLVGGPYTKYHSLRTEPLRVAESGYMDMHVYHALHVAGISRLMPAPAALSVLADLPSCGITEVRIQAEISYTLQLMVIGVFPGESQHTNISTKKPSASLHYPTHLFPNPSHRGNQSDSAAVASTRDEMIGESSILRYEDPVLARPAEALPRGHDSLPQYVSLYASSERRPIEGATRLTEGRPTAPGAARSKRRPRSSGDDNTAVLRAILPNKEYDDEAGKWVQAVRANHWKVITYGSA